MEFLVGNTVFLKASPVKDMRSSTVKEKLSPMHIRPHEIIEMSNLVA